MAMVVEERAQAIAVVELGPCPLSLAIRRTWQSVLRYLQLIYQQPNIRFILFLFLVSLCRNNVLDQAVSSLRTESSRSILVLVLEA